MNPAPTRACLLDSEHKWHVGLPALARGKVCHRLNSSWNGKDRPYRNKDRFESDRQKSDVTRRCRSQAVRREHPAAPRRATSSAPRRAGAGIKRQTVASSHAIEKRVAEIGRVSHRQASRRTSSLRSGLQAAQFAMRKFRDSRVDERFLPNFSVRDMSVFNPNADMAARSQIATLC